MKHYKLIAILIFTALLSVALCGCSDPTEYDELFEQGYTVSVTYDNNGADEFNGSKNNSIVDMFNPDDYAKDPNGVAHVKLMEPTNVLRPSGGSDPISLTKKGYFFAGWYKERTFKTNEKGEILDWDGKVLEEKYGGYYVKDAETETIGYPACVSYSGYWDFANDTIDVGENREVSLTLYAGWVPYYQFDYYYQVDGKWEKYGETTFDYKTTNREGSTTFDRDTLFVPSYENGAMNYVTQYNDKRSYTFPKIDGYTFNSAYTDEACTKLITDKFEHEGSLDLETGVAVNRVQNIYVKFDEGEIYKIDTAAQLAENANVNGIYYLNNDLTFTEDVKWPVAFSYNYFNGKIYGQGHVIKNAYVSFASTSAKLGGLFGGISETAVIDDLTFENVTVDYVVTGYVKECNFGLISGSVSEKATLNFKVKGELTMKFGNVSLNTADGGDDIAIYQIADNLDGITVESAQTKVVVYGVEQYGTEPKLYDYTIKNDSVKAEGGRIYFTVEAALDATTQAEYTYNYSIGG